MHCDHTSGGMMDQKKSSAPKQACRYLGLVCGLHRLIFFFCLKLWNLVKNQVCFVQVFKSLGGWP